jgi:hypothetical protein
MIEPTTEDLVAQKLNGLVRLVLNSIRVQALTMHLLVLSSKDLSDDRKRELIEKINQLEKAAAETRLT